MKRLFLLPLCLLLLFATVSAAGEDEAASQTVVMTHVTYTVTGACFDAPSEGLDGMLEAHRWMSLVGADSRSLTLESSDTTFTGAKSLRDTGTVYYYRQDDYYTVSVSLYPLPAPAWQTWLLAAVFLVPILGGSTIVLMIFRRKMQKQTTGFLM